jgi:polysaccharide export outer membrane protein
MLKGIVVIGLDAETTKRTMPSGPSASFLADLEPAMPLGSVVRQGDVLEVSIWEAPPAALFGASATTALGARQNQLSTTATLPELLVSVEGTIFIPFAGTIRVAGRTPAVIEAEIVRRLSGKAHQPQAIVRIARNASTNATVVGEVVNSVRVPLTPKGETLLDALAQAGGARHPSSRMTLQITRGEKVIAMPMDDVIRNPQQNVVLAAGDVVTAIFQPYSFSILGAAGRTDEVVFESTGISLAQALARVGGLQDQRANAKGVFIFRWEEPANLAIPTDGPTDARGRRPVIYRVDLRNPATLFLAQNFRMRDGDVVYVANAPITEFQQFVNIIASTVLPLVAVSNTVQ